MLSTSGSPPKRPPPALPCMWHCRSPFSPLDPPLPCKPPTLCSCNSPGLRVGEGAGPTLFASLSLLALQHCVCVCVYVCKRVPWGGRGTALSSEILQKGFQMESLKKQRLAAGGGGGGVWEALVPKENLDLGSRILA